MNVVSVLRHNTVTARVEMSCVNLIFLFFISLGFVLGNENDLRRIDAIQPEDQCSKAGGMCVIAADCPDGHLAEQRGLCPKQRSQGIECCHGISMKETRCKKHGGICISDRHCNPRLIYDIVTDCVDGKICCIMVE